MRVCGGSQGRSFHGENIFFIDLILKVCGVPICDGGRKEVSAVWVPLSTPTLAHAVHALPQACTLAPPVCSKPEAERREPRGAAVTFGRGNTGIGRLQCAFALFEDPEKTHILGQWVWARLESLHF